MSFDSTFLASRGLYRSSFAAILQLPSVAQQEPGQPLCQGVSRGSCNRICKEGVLAVGPVQCPIIANGKTGSAGHKFAASPSAKNLQTSPQEAACRRFDEEAKTAKARWYCGGVSAGTTAALQRASNTKSLEAFAKLRGLCNECETNCPSSTVKS